MRCRACFSAVFSKKWLIISKKPWFTGIQAGFQAEFTTNLLLLRERALICRPEPCKLSHQHTALRKNKWKLNTTQTRRFSIPTRENRNAAFFMPSCYAVGAKRALLYSPYYILLFTFPFGYVYTVLFDGRNSSHFCYTVLCLNRRTDERFVNFGLRLLTITPKRI